MREFFTTLSDRIGLFLIPAAFLMTLWYLTLSTSPHAMKWAAVCAVLTAVGVRRQVRGHW